MYANPHIDQLADSYRNGAEPTNDGLNRLVSAFSRKAHSLLAQRKEIRYCPIVVVMGDGITAYAAGDARTLADCYRKLDDVRELDVVHLG